MALSYTREIERAREEMAHHAADVAHMRREIERLENVIAQDLAEPIRITASLVDQLVTRCGDDLGDEGRVLLDGLQRWSQRMQDTVERSA